MALGLLIMRLAIGLTLAAHGAQKLFGLFGGHGLAGTGGFFESLGFRPGRPLAALAGVGELCGGLAVALGFLTPLGSALIVATMIVAIMGVHLEKGFFSQSGGYEFALIVGLVAAGIAFTGPGAFSLDATFGLRLGGVRWGMIAMALGLVGALPPLFARSAALRRGRAT